MDIAGIMNKTNLYYGGMGAKVDDVLAEKSTSQTLAESMAETAEKQTEEPIKRGSWYQEHKDGLGNVPYAAREKNGVIEYNGVIFNCDEERNAITLGDTTNAANTLTIPLEKGGCLMVNRDNLGQLADAIGMFSPEDVNRILRAIAADNKARQMQQELEEDKNSLGDSADSALETRAGNTEGAENTEETGNTVGAENTEETGSTEGAENTEETGSTEGAADEELSVTMQAQTLEEEQKGKEAKKEDADALEWDKNPVTQEQINKLFQNREE